MSFDESLLDDPDALALRDDGRLLWALAGSGAQVRRAVDIADELDVSRLAGGAVPRALLVAVDSPAKGAGRVLVRLATGVTPTLMWHGVELPRWAGSADALLVASSDGRHPRLARVTEQGTHRGLAVAVAAPEGSPVAEAAGRAPVAHLPADVNRRALMWALLTPLLQAAHVLEVTSVPPALLAQVADALDETAEGCRPFADALQLFAGVPAVAVSLPDGVAAAGALLFGEPQGSFEDEFFRDRTDEQH